MDWAEQYVQEQNKADEVVHFCAVLVEVDEAYSDRILLMLVWSDRSVSA